MAIEREAHATWEGDLRSGEGRFDLESSGAVSGEEVTFSSRFEQPGGKTSPEELIAAAHATCFSMALANGLAQPVCELCVQLAWILAQPGSQLGSQQAQQNAVLVGRPGCAVKTQERRASALFATKAQGAIQETTDKPLKPHWHFVQLSAKFCCNSIDHLAGGERRGVTGQDCIRRG